VLKITITDLPDEQRWSLHGQLIGQWAAELRSSWREAQQEENARRCIVELIEVTSIDLNGEAVLAEIMSQGAEFIASDVYIKHLLRKLRGELKRSRTKGNEDGGSDHQ
jgi:ABC-type transporter Mla MlaB component